MFSPASSLRESQASAHRVSRRRQREDSDSHRHQPVRKRSKLSEDTFAPPSNPSSYPHSSYSSFTTSAKNITSATAYHASASASASAFTSTSDTHVNGNAKVLLDRNGSADSAPGLRSASRTKDIPVREKKKQQQQQQQQAHHPQQSQQQQEQEQEQNHAGQQQRSQRDHREQQPQHSLQRHELHLQQQQSYASKRALKADGSMILTRNSQYMVKRLPALPEQLQGRSQEDYRVHVPYSSAHALAVTHDHAYIWDYSLSLSTPVPQIVSLPNLSRYGQSLPLGSIVRNGPSSDMSLVIVSTSTGKIFFWENVDLAGSQNLFQQKPERVEGSVGGLLSGETVVDLIDADQAGFVLHFSTGRLAQLTTRDSQGNAHVEVRFMRSQASTGSSGLFGGLRTVFSAGSWRRDVKAVRIRPSQLRGHREAISVTEGGIFQAWDLTWSSQAQYLLEIDAQQEIINGLQGSMNYSSAELEFRPRVLDFVILPDHTYDGREVALPNTEGGLRALVLVTEPKLVSANYTLLQMTLKPTVAVERLIAIDAYTGMEGEGAAWSPRLMMPSPAHTAFVVFGDAIAIVSLTRNSDTPDSQLLAESTVSVNAFQDIIYFRPDREVQVLTCQAENHGSKSVHSNLLVYLKNYGFLRLVADEASPGAKVSVHSKIEQAVFYGRVTDNVLDFSAKQNAIYPTDEVESAALIVSQKILSSRAEVIPEIMTSMEQQLALRSMFMRRLILHLKRNCKPLSRQVRWKLLWSAEKMHAAEALWKHYDSRLRMKNMPTRPFVDDLFYILPDQYKTEMDDALGEHDQTRMWFVRDVGRFEYVVPYCMHALQSIQADSKPGKVEIAQMLSEANDIILVSLEAAFRFRQDNLELFGLEDEELDFGVLVSGYDGLPAFWTSTQNIVYSVMHQTRLLERTVKEVLDGALLLDGMPGLTEKLISHGAPMVKYACLTYIERFRWCLAQDDEKTRATGRNLKHDFETKTRKDLLLSLHKSGSGESAIQLAEDLHDMPTLVQLVTMEFDEYLYEISGCKEAARYEELWSQANELGVRAGEYFNRFGDSYSTAFFNHYINMGRFARMLDEAERTHPRLTNYLRAEPARAKICWINDVLHERDLERAGRVLLDVAKRQENDVWCKKVEVSMAKLAILAADEDGPKRSGKQGQVQKEEPTDPSNESSTATLHANMRQRADRELRQLAIQERVYRHVKHAAYNPLDRAAEIELVMQEYGVGQVANKPALAELLRQGFLQMFSSQAVDAAHLVDVLTLMDSAPNPVQGDDICGREFLLALQVLDDAETVLPGKEEVLRLVWKRLFLRDDWEGINNTVDKADEDVQLELEGTVLFRTLKAGAEIGLWDSTTSTSTATTLRSSTTSSSSTHSNTIKRLPPSEVLGAGCSVDQLKLRFSPSSSSPSSSSSYSSASPSTATPADDTALALAGPLARDNDADDARLQTLISRCRLGYWYSACKDGAAKSVEREAERRARRRKREMALEEMLVERDREGEVGGDEEGSEEEDGGDGDDEGEGEGDGESVSLDVGFEGGSDGMERVRNGVGDGIGNGDGDGQDEGEGEGEANSIDSVVEDDDDDSEYEESDGDEDATMED